jgi:uncharacterized membrane protein
MLILVFLIISFIVFRALGFAGVAVFASWQASARDALALMLFLTASGHFTSMKDDLVRMMPGWIPWPRAMVYFTGICEVAGAIGLLIPSVRHAAGLCLVAFFIAILPANIHAAREGITLRGKPATALLWRIPMQVVFIALAWWTTR